MTDNDSALADTAEIIHGAMVWAARQGGEPQHWCNGNSFAEDKARDAAREILALRTTGEAQPDAQAVELLRGARMMASMASTLDWQEDRNIMQAVHLAADIDTFLAALAPTPAAERCKALLRDLRDELVGPSSYWSGVSLINRIDRELAGDYLLFVGDTEYSAACRSGGENDKCKIVQAFARHRLAERANINAERGEQAELASEAALVDWLSDNDPSCGYEDCRYTARLLWPIINAEIAAAVKDANQTIIAFAGNAFISLDGTVITLDGRGEGDKAVIVLTAGGKQIDCHVSRVPEDQLRAIWKKRCIVRGMGHYAGNGVLPDYIDAVDIKPAPMGGGWADWRGSMSAPEGLDDWH